MSEEKEQLWMPGGRGGMLKRGNTKNVGRPLSAVSKAALKAADEKGLPFLIDVAEGRVEASVADRIKAIERLGTWGGLNKSDITSDGEKINSVDPLEAVARIKAILEKK